MDDEIKEAKDNLRDFFEKMLNTKIPFILSRNDGSPDDLRMNLSRSETHEYMNIMFCWKHRDNVRYDVDSFMKSLPAKISGVYFRRGNGFIYNGSNMHDWRLWDYTLYMNVYCPTKEVRDVYASLIEELIDIKKTIREYQSSNSYSKFDYVSEEDMETILKIFSDTRKQNIDRLMNSYNANLEDIINNTPICEVKELNFWN